MSAAYRESDRAALEVGLKVLHVGTPTHKGEVGVGWQARKEVLQHLQVLLCTMQIVFKKGYEQWVSEPASERMGGWVSE